MKNLKNALSRHKEIAAPPVGFVGLQQHFQSVPPSSFDALLTKMGPFTPETDAFRFKNSFPITEENAAQLRQHYQVVLDVVSGGGVHQVSGVLGSINLNPFPVGPSISLPDAISNEVIGKVTSALTGALLDKIIGAIPGSGFGRCGGMAFAGYDFFLLHWPVDERLGTTPPATGDLGDYIFARLLDSLDLNATTFLTWVMNLHIMPVISKIATTALLTAAGDFGGPIGSAVGALIGTQVDIFKLGGPKSTLSSTKDEWPKITGKLDAEAAWPIGLIYSDNASPFEQHQVLAVGYMDNGDGTATLTVWDNNDGNQPRPFGLDMRGDELQVSNSKDNRPIKGIFLEDYASHQPPSSLKLS